MRIIIFILISAVLSSCTTDAERAAAREKRVQEDMSYADQMCVSYGFKKEDQYFALCMQTVINNLKQERAAERARDQAFWQGISAAGEALQSTSTDLPAKTQRMGGRNVTCTPQPNRNSFYCREW